MTKKNPKGFITPLFAKKALTFHHSTQKMQIWVHGDSPTIVVTSNALNAMLQLVDTVDVEVGWLGHAVRQAHGVIRIDRIILFKQEVSSAVTTLDAQSIVETVERLINNGEEDIATSLRFWGHSHAYLPTNPSLQDDKTMEQFGQDGAPFMVRGIFNKSGSARWDVWDYERNLVFLHVPWSVETSAIEDKPEVLAKEIQEKVCRKTSPYYRDDFWQNWPEVWGYPEHQPLTPPPVQAPESKKNPNSFGYCDDPNFID